MAAADNRQRKSTGEAGNEAQRQEVLALIAREAEPASLPVIVSPRNSTFNSSGEMRSMMRKFDVGRLRPRRVKAQHAFAQRRRGVEQHEPADTALAREQRNGANLELAPGGAVGGRAVTVCTAGSFASASAAGRRGDLAQSTLAGEGRKWLINIPRREIEVRAEPVDGIYSRVTPYRSGDAPTPEAFPELALGVDEIMPLNR